MSARYPVPAGPGEASLVVRRSRFLALADRVDTREAALTVVEQARRAHPEARHHCWAYLIGDPVAATGAASSDDGEPGGTAGRPILNVLQHKGLGDTVVVVSRYFGGVKLGAGGLVRAYAGATEAVLTATAVIEREPLWRPELALDFAAEQPLRHWADEHGAMVEAVEYGEGVRMRLAVPEAVAHRLADFCGATGVRLLTALPGQPG